MADWTEQELIQVVGEVLRRSTVDPEFRALAQKNPNAAVAKVTTRALPNDFTLQFHENSGSVKHFILPDPVAGIEELSEEDLKAVAGGGFQVAWGR